MAAILHIADGLDITKSSSIMAELYACISRHTSEEKLARWLRDVSQRPAAFLDVRLLGLVPEIRSAFCAALEVAYRSEARPVIKAAMSEILRAIDDAKKKELDFLVRPSAGMIEDLDQSWSEEKTPNQPPEPMSGLAPGHGSS
jgi:hypothetical protein